MINVMTADQINHHESVQLAKDKNYDPASDPLVRASGLGGSDMATVLGINSFKSPLQLWAEKRGTWLHPENVNEKLPVRIGQKLEDDICEMFAEDHDLKLNHFRKTPRHDRLGWAMAHPDRRIVGGWEDKRAIVEAKWSSRVSDWGQPETNQIPAYYLPQVHQEMWLTDSEVCLVPVWLFRFQIEPKYYIVERDEEWIEILKEAGDRFWRCVLTGDEPHVDYNDAASQAAIQKIYRDGFEENKFVDMGRVGAEVVASLERNKADEKTFREGAAADNARLSRLMGNAQFGRLPDGRWIKRTKKRTGRTIIEPYDKVDQRIVNNLPKGVEEPVSFSAPQRDTIAHEPGPVFDAFDLGGAEPHQKPLTIIDERESANPGIDPEKLKGLNAHEVELMVKTKGDPL